MGGIQWTILVSLLLLNYSNCNAIEGDVFRLASYYADHMVLQKEPNQAVIWGYAEIGATINITFKSEIFSTKAEKAGFTEDGVWRFQLPPTPPSGPFTIKIKSNFQDRTEEITLNDVLFGDVWLCGGQSNMAFSTPDAFNATQVLLNAYKYPEIRLLAIAQKESNETQYDFSQFYELWTKPDPGTLGMEATAFTYFSAVCYLFGVQLFQHLGYPIGLISDNWGGTPIQAWSSPEVIASCPSAKFSPNRKVVESKYNVLGPHDSSELWNAMIHPLLNFTINGAIWYQGEANSVEPAEKYACLFPAMIKDWRKKWFQGTGGQTHPMFPFGFVQLCTSDVLNDTTFPGIRWAQTADYGYAPNPLMPNVFMAVAIDLPDVKSPFGPIHPRYKQDVANRLALAARGVAYNEHYALYQGPFPSKISCNAKMQRINITYQFVNVTVRSHEDLFEVCCSSTIACEPNGVWTPAVLVSIPSVNSITLSYSCATAGAIPKSVRYLWKDMPCAYKDCAIYGRENDLPSPPFELSVEGC